MSRAADSFSDEMTEGKLRAQLEAAEAALNQLRGERGRLFEALLWLCASALRLDLAQVVEDVTGIVLSLTGANVAIWAPAEGTGTDVPDMSYEERGLARPPDLDDLPSFTEILSRILWRGEPVQVDDVLTVPAGEGAGGEGAGGEGAGGEGAGGEGPSGGGQAGSQVRSWVGVPVKARYGDVLGALFVGGSQPGAFGREEMELVEALASYLGARFETLALFRERAQVAGALQQTLLPPPLPEIPGLEVAARYRPAKAAARVGGDFYDLFEVEEGAWGFIVGDVSGVGPEAAALTGVARYGARAVASAEHSPSDLLQQLNETLVRLRLKEKFCTALYAHLRPQGRDVKVVMANAGHPYPFVLRQGNKVEEVEVHGTLLGAFEQLNFEERELTLAPGELMVCYTDGVTEARDDEGRLFGTEGLVRVLSSGAGASAREVARSIELAVLDHEGGGTRDDMALMVLRNPGLPGAQAATGPRQVDAP